MVKSSPGSSGTAAVTGGASGIGLAFCRELASRGFHLILIDRSREAATAAAMKLEADFAGTRATVCTADLTDPGDLEECARLLRSHPSLTLLINGAGFGTCGTFLETDFAKQKAMIDLHIVASVTLCHAVLPAMVVRNAGAIINIASISAYTRFPETSIYSGSKMFLVAFTECIEADLRKIGAVGIRVQALCPGQTRTPFTDTEAMRQFDPSRVPSFMWMTPEQLVTLSLNALARHSGTYIPLLKNRLFVLVFGNRAIIRLLAILRKFGLLEAFLRLFRR